MTASLAPEQEEEIKMSKAHFCMLIFYFYARRKEEHSISPSTCKSKQLIKFSKFDYIQLYFCKLISSLLNHFSPSEPTDLLIINILQNKHTGYVIGPGLSRAGFQSVLGKLSGQLVFSNCREQIYQITQKVALCCFSC